MEHFYAVFKPDLTEETSAQLQEEEAIASSCLILAMPVVELIVVVLLWLLVADFCECVVAEKHIFAEN